MEMGTGREATAVRHEEASVRVLLATGGQSGEQDV